MSRFKRRFLILVAPVTLLIGTALGIGGVAPAGALTAGAAPYCGITWGSLPREGGSLSPGALLASRTGQHPCFDRVVFEFSGPANGFRVQYANEVLTEGQGLPLSPITAGGGLLSVHLLEPAYGESGQATFAHQTGDHVANTAGYRTLRDVVFGGSFEGHTTFAVGVRARLPFQVFALTGPGSHSRIVVDIAHRWS
jgi:hypothetical protein